MMVMVAALNQLGVDTTSFVALLGAAGVAVGFVVERPERYTEALRRASDKARGLVAIDHRILLEDPSRIEEARKAGAAVVVWTVDDADTADQLYRMGILDFTTNRVDKLLEWKAGAATGS